MTRFILREAAAPGEAPRRAVLSFFAGDRLPLTRPEDVSALNRGEPVRQTVGRETWVFVDLEAFYLAHQAVPA